MDNGAGTTASPSGMALPLRRALVAEIRTNDGNETLVEVTWVYDARDPLAVSAVFTTSGGSPVVWTFARDLLVDGLEGPVGEGDVQVWPASDDDVALVCVALASPSGEAVVGFDAAEVEEFCRASLVRVPRGSEVVTGLDELISALLG